MTVMQVVREINTILNGLTSAFEARFLNDDATALLNLTKTCQVLSGFFPGNFRCYSIFCFEIPRSVGKKKKKK
jgi:hypothetical protein